MQVSEFVLYQDYPLHVMNNLLLPQNKRPLTVRNLQMKKHMRNSVSGGKRKEKKQIEKYKKPNNNPRLLLIQRTKQVIGGWADGKNKTLGGSPASMKSYRGRHLSSSASRRPGRYEL